MESQSLRELLNDDTLAPVIVRATWMDVLPPEIQREMTEVKTLWQSGELKMSAHRTATKLRAALQRRGVAKTPSQTSVSNWLRS